MIMIEVKESKYTCWEVSGTLRDMWSDTICLMVHGFWRTSHDRLLRNYARELSIKNINTLRINLYSWTNTENISLAKNIKDINDITKSLSADYKKIFYVWHSLWGALWFMVDQNNLDWILSRDPAVVWERYRDVAGCFEERGKSYVFKYWAAIGISKLFYTELLNLEGNYINWILNPYQIICCSEVWTIKHWKGIGVESNEQIIGIPWSSHFFQERWAEEKLFDLSNRFIEGVMDR